MLDLLTTLLPLIGGGIFGAIFKMLGNAQKAKAEYNRNMFQALTGDRKEREDIRNNNSKGFAWTRRIIVFAVLSVVVGVFWTTGKVTIPVEVIEGSQYLFGLIDTRVTSISMETVDSGRVVLPVMIPTFQAIVGFYIGQSTIGSIR